MKLFYDRTFSWASFRSALAYVFCLTYHLHIFKNAWSRGPNKQFLPLWHKYQFKYFQVENFHHKNIISVRQFKKIIISKLITAEILAGTCSWIGNAVKYSLWHLLNILLVNYFMLQLDKARMHDSKSVDLNNIYCAASLAWPEVALRFCPWLPLTRWACPELFLLCLLCVSVVMANECKEVFFWPIQFHNHLHCVTQMWMRQ